jgi:GH25 family lysozyme M1 (1,4-beta-N-acetylmuramidase)
MQIKAPAVYDISHWKEVLDFNLISPRPFLMITKATESNWLKDSKFIRFFDGMKFAGYKRGCYHFFRKRIEARSQALFFCNFIEPYIDNETILILDVEEGGETAEQLKTWFDVVRGIYPRNRLLLYSAKRILDPIPMTAAEREYFKTIPVWTAGYPYFPDAFTSVPPVYIPDPSKFGPVVLWQYSEVGQVAGIEGVVDLNWISPTYQQLLGAAVLPQEGTQMLKGKVLKLTNIRSARTQFSADVGDLLAGDIVEWEEEAVGSDGLVWLKLVTATHNGAPVKCTDGADVGGRFCWANNVEEIVPPAPEPEAIKVPDYLIAHFEDGTEKKYILA